MLTLDHVNIQTADVDGLTAFYVKALGLVAGPRPTFGFPGAWLYAGNTAVIHLVGVEKQPLTREPTLEHFAFAATGDLADFTQNLETADIPYGLNHLTDIEVVQVRLTDPDGNRLHVDFRAPGA